MKSKSSAHVWAPACVDIQNGAGRALAWLHANLSICLAAAASTAADENCEWHLLWAPLPLKLELNLNEPALQLKYWNPEQIPMSHRDTNWDRAREKSRKKMGEHCKRCVKCFSHLFSISLNFVLGHFAGCQRAMCNCNLQLQAAKQNL